MVNKLRLALIQVIDQGLRVLTQGTVHRAASVFTQHGSFALRTNIQTQKGED